MLNSSIIRQGLRGLLRTPRWTVVAVLSLALGIGANTLVFSLVDAVLLEPFPFPKAEQLVLLWGAKNEQVRRGLSGPDLDDIRSESRIFQGIARFIGTHIEFRLDGDDSSIVNASYVDPGVFSVLGVEPARGRGFLPEEDDAGREKVVVLSHGLWVSRYASNPGVVGRSIRLDGEPYLVVGVMPPEFFFPDLNSHLWLPLSRSKWGDLSVRGHALVHAVGRLKAGVTLRQAQAEIDTIARRLELAYPATNKGLIIGLFPLYRVVVGKYYAALWTLLGAVGFVLLIACANVANLLLARAAEREKELAVRAALGASRRDLLGHLLTEAVIVALLGGAAGVLFAYWGIRFVRTLGLRDIPRVDVVGINFEVLVFTLGISLLTVLVFGLGPSLVASRLNVNEALARGSSRGASRSRLRDLLVMSEVALAVVLLVGAGLLVNSFVRLTRLNWGFRPENVLVVTVQPPASAMTSVANRMDYTQRVLSRVEMLPAVESAAISYAVPLDQISWRPKRDLAVGGRVVTQDWNQWKGGEWYVGPGYFRSLGIPIIRGREFSPQDDPTSRPGVVISKDLADKLWPGEDPVGKELQLVDLTLSEAGKATIARGKVIPRDDLIQAMATGQVEWRLHPPREVVGVVGNVRMFGVELATDPALYINVMEQLRDRPFQIILRTSGDPAKLADAVKALISDVDREVSIRKIETMEELIRRSIGGRGANKLLLLVSVMFGSLGLMLTAGGIYGVLSYAVTQRTHEFGVRMALGAAPRDIIRLVTRHGSRLIVCGTVLGSAGAWALTRLLSSFLFDVKPTDPTTFAGAVLLLAAVGLFACLTPARQATQTDPAEILRYE